MLRIASNTFNREFDNIAESEKEELKSLLSMSKEQISNEITTLKESVVNKLQTTINENDDKEITSRIDQTIQKINESKNTLISLYKLRQLHEGL